MSALAQLVVGEELVRDTDLSLPEVGLLPCALPLGCCTLVRFKGLDLSVELRPGITALEKSDVLWVPVWCTLPRWDLGDWRPSLGLGSREA